MLCLKKQQKIISKIICWRHRSSDILVVNSYDGDDRVFPAPVLGRLLLAAPGDGSDQCDGNVLGGLSLGVRGIPLGQRH